MPTAKVRQVQLRRAPGKSAAMHSAAIPERKLAICHEVSEQALMAAPPVEKRNAARKSWSLLRAREVSNFI